jgi:hypothetical protein
LLVKVANTGQTNARLAYYKFDLTTATIADGVNATFGVGTTASATADFTLRLYALNAGDPDFNWTQETLTYNNRPAFNDSSNPLLNLTKVTQLGTDFTVTNGAGAGTTISFAVPNWNSFRQSDDSLSLVLVVTSQSNNAPSLSVGASENTIAARTPQLTIVPEPAGLAVAAIGTGLLMARRRRG